MNDIRKRARIWDKIPRKNRVGEIFFPRKTYTVFFASYVPAGTLFRLHTGLCRLIVSQKFSLFRSQLCFSKNLRYSILYRTVNMPYSVLRRSVIHREHYKKPINTSAFQKIYSYTKLFLQTGQHGIIKIIIYSLHFADFPCIQHPPTSFPFPSSGSRSPVLHRPVSLSWISLPQTIQLPLLSQHLPPGKLWSRR